MAATQRLVDPLLIFLDKAYNIDTVHRFRLEAMVDAGDYSVLRATCGPRDKFVTSAS
jgi:hypothetical protein